MAATIIINRLTGAGPTKTAITSGNTRASSSDNPYTTETTNPVPIPGAGTNYSYWVVTRLECTVAPTTLVDNLKWFTDGTDSTGTGIGIQAQDATSYDQATGTLGTTGDVLNTTNYPTLTGATVDAFTLTSGSPKSVAGSTSTIQEFGNYMVYQFSVDNTASAGATPAETFTWQYDET